MRFKPGEADRAAVCGEESDKVMVRTVSGNREENDKCWA